MVNRIAPPSNPRNNGPGAGSLTGSLRRAARQDLYVVAIVFVAAFAVAIIADLAEMYRQFTTRHESWELDELAMAAMFTMVAFCWFAWRQWRRFSEELTRRVKLEQDTIELRTLSDSLGKNKATFLANLGHDLRTPLNGILGFAQLLDEAPFGPIGNERYKSYIKSIRESAEMLDQRIASCLDPDKIEFGAEPLQMKPWPLHELIASAMRVVAPVAENAGIRIELDIEGGLPDLHADARAIKKILVNLVSNAIQFTHRSGTIRIAARETGDDRLEIVVRDDGVGAAGESPEGQASDAGRSAPQPYGLDVGLPIVRTLLALHGATMVIDSVRSKGTTAIVSFPPERLVDSNLTLPTADRRRIAE